ncbi:unnamed protein product [Cunninghamella blakesleeana]
MNEYKCVYIHMCVLFIYYMVFRDDIIYIYVIYGKYNNDGHEMLIRHLVSGLKENNWIINNKKGLISRMHTEHSKRRRYSYDNINNNNNNNNNNIVNYPINTCSKIWSHGVPKRSYEEHLEKNIL